MCVHKFVSTYEAGLQELIWEYNNEQILTFTQQAMRSAPWRSIDFSIHGVHVPFQMDHPG